MALPRAFTLRRVCQPRRPCFVLGQRREAQVHDLRFFQLHARRQDKYIEKYKEKLEQKAREVGVKDINELRQVVREQQKPLPQRPASASTSSPFPPPPPPPQPQAAPSASISSPNSSSSSSSKPKIRTLSSFLDVDKVSSLPPTEISQLWRLRHASTPNSLCASIPKDVYAKILATAVKHPQFILPLPREASEATAGAGHENGGAQNVGERRGAADIHFLQWTHPSPSTSTVLFTHLAEFKARGEYAQPHTTVTHHTDLLESKGVVLLEGNVMDGKGVSADEGRWLLMCLQKFYGGWEGGMGREDRARRRLELLRMFSEGDETFRVEDLLDEAERIG